MKSLETPNKGKNGYDIALERGEDTPTLEQLKEFKPEAFDVNRLEESVLQELDRLMKNLPDSFKADFKGFKTRLSEYMALKDVNMDFDINEKEVSSLNVKSPIQMQATDVVLKDIQGLMVKLSDPIQTMQTATVLANFMSQLKTILDERSLSLDRALHHLKRLNEDEERIVEKDLNRSQNGDYEDRVALRKVDSRLDVLGKQKKSTDGKVRKRKVLLKKAESSLEQVVKLLRHILNGNIEDYPNMEELEKYASGLEILDDDYVKNAIQSVLSEPYRLQYRAHNADMQQQVDKEKRVERIRATFRTWSTRFALFAALLGGAVLIHNRESECPLNEQSEVQKTSNSLIVKDPRFDAVHACLKACNIACKPMAIEYFDNHPFAKQFFVDGKIFNIEQIGKVNKKTGKAPHKIFIDYKVIADKLMTILFPPEARIINFTYNYSKEEFKLKISEQLIRNIMKQVGCMELKFYINSKSGRYPKNSKQYLPVRGNEVIVSKDAICHPDGIEIRFDVVLESPGVDYSYGFSGLGFGDIHITKYRIVSKTCG